MNAFFYLHAFAITIHLSCGLYAFATPSAYESEFKMDLTYVDFSNRTDSSPYFSKREGLTFAFPSAILLHGIVAFVTAFFHLVLYVPLHYGFANTIWNVKRALWVRWVEYSTTCTLMTIASLLGNGTTDFHMIMTAVFSGVALQAVGANVEQLKSLGRTATFSLFAIGVLIEMGTTWTVLWVHLSSTSTSVTDLLEVTAFVFYYSLFAVNNLYDALYRKTCFVRTDWFYNVLSLTSKVSLFWLHVGEVQRVFYPGPWPHVQIYVFGILFPLFVLAACVRIAPRNCSPNVEDRWTKNGFYKRIVSASLL